VCHVAHIEVNGTRDANKAARQAADELARGFDCKTDKISVVGMSGRVASLAMASR